MSSSHPSASPHGSPSLGPTPSPIPLSPEQELIQLRGQVQQMFAQQQQLLQGQAALHAAQQAAAVAPAVVAPAAPRPFLPKLRQPSQFKGEMGFVVDDWISEMEQQFAYYEIADPLARIKMAIAGLAGPAIHWWEHEPNKAGVVTWVAFVARLHARFRPVQAAMIARQRLDKLRQKAGQSVNAYANVFQSTLTPIGDMGAADQVHHFVNGLLPYIAGKVWERHPLDLRSAIDTAVSVEAMGNFGRSAVPHTFGRQGGSSAGTSSAPMDLNQVGLESEEADRDPSQAGDSVSAAILAKLEAMDLRINALAQGGAGVSTSNKKSNSKVSGLKPGDIDRLRSENRCFRCKKTGHFKRECPESSF
jgi:hypothetical protein